MTEEIFTCRMCGKCCRGYGGTYVSTEDIATISEFIGVDPADFAARYCSLSGGRHVLAQAKDGFCVFFDEKCTIHPVKPRMCRKWPFIEALLLDPGNWEAMASSCPGMHKGARPEVIDRAVREFLATF